MLDESMEVSFWDLSSVFCWFPLRHWLLNGTAGAMSGPVGRALRGQARPTRPSWPSSFLFTVNLMISRIYVLDFKAVQREASDILLKKRG